MRPHHSGRSDSCRNLLPASSGLGVTVASGSFPALVLSGDWAATVRQRRGWTAGRGCCSSFVPRCAAAYSFRERWVKRPRGQESVGEFPCRAHVVTNWSGLDGSRVLVTGGTGFVGQHLVQALVSTGKEVFVASRNAAKLAGVQIVPGDLAQPGEVARLLEAVRPNVVFNLTGRRSKASTDQVAETIRINLMVAIELVTESLRRAVRKIILVGSAEEYGDQIMPVSEDAALKPRSIYGASKAAMTLHALALYETSRAPVIVVRPFSVYGPGAPRHMFVAEAADCAARGVAFQMTDGIQKRDLVHVTDVVQGLLAAAVVPEAVGKVFNLGTGVSHSMRDVAEALWRLSGTSAALQIGARAKPPGDLKETCANIDRARSMLGWLPRVELEDGLRSTWLAASRGK